MRLRSGVHAPPFLYASLHQPPRRPTACDVRAPSCPPLSFHLRHSQPTPSIPPSFPPLLRPTLLPLSINLPPPSTHPTIPPPPSICLPGPPTHFTLFLSEALLSHSLLPSLLHPIISGVRVSVLLVLCHSIPIPQPVFLPHVCVFPQHHLGLCLIFFLTASLVC